MREGDLGPIIRRGQAGDREALAELVRRFQRPVYAYLARMAPDLAEDACQETFVRVLQGLPRYEHRDRFQAWLFRLATNALIDAARSRRRAAEPLAIDAVADPYAGPLEAAQRAETHRGLAEALARLPFEQRQVVTLKMHGALTFREIAQILDRPLGTVLARMHRAVAALRRTVRG
jgi:RNA polymerase sigma-70 factor (ECF subfamily)